MDSSIVSLVNYASIKNKLTEFILKHESASGHAAAGKGKHLTKSLAYVDQIKSLEQGGQSFRLHVDDVLKYLDYKGELPPPADDKNAGLIVTLLYNGSRALRLVYDVVEKILEERLTDGGDANTSSDPRVRVWNTIRKDPTLPTIHRVPYSIFLVSSSKGKSVPLHELKASHIGHTLDVEGLVGRVGVSRPCLQVAVYKCEDCGQMRYQHLENSSFVPLTNCGADRCQKSKKKGTLHLCAKESKFVKQQEVWIQELPSLVPPGKIPQMLKVVLRGELTDKLRPGSEVRLGGFFGTEWEGGWNRGSSYTQQQHVVFEVQSILDKGEVYSSLREVKTNAERVIANYAGSSGSGHALYDLMAESVAPTIFGHEDVKKALLLQLLGGCEWDAVRRECTSAAGQASGAGQTSEASVRSSGSVRIRGSLHVLLVGDPGIAKSQLLLRMCELSERGKYSCGKGTSGVGLTACVVKDPSTNEFSLEAGATVLADGGVCCIDEFDKMGEQDRTAIHEVMEQQTVSISKAGIVATLNARTAILAAANPPAGRYDLHKSVLANVGLPAALLSRFDVLFVLLDRPGAGAGTAYDADKQMATHLLTLSKDKTLDHSRFRLSPNELKYVIHKCKQCNPLLPQELVEKVVEYYKTARAQSGSASDESTYVTPRSLMAILRLSQALAKTRFSGTVAEEDLQEAIRLSEAGRQSVVANTAAHQHAIQPSHKKAMKCVKGLMEAGEWVTVDAAIEEGAAAGLEPGDIEEAIEAMVASCSCVWNNITRTKFKKV